MIQERGRSKQPSRAKLAREEVLRNRLQPLVERDGFNEVGTACFRFAKRAERKNWASEESAIKSVRTLLKDACVIPGDRAAVWTGHCKNWVLDNFDAFLADRLELERRDPVQSQPHENANTGLALAVIEPAEFAAALDDLDPEPEEEPGEIVVDIELSLSNRLLAAYLDRDDEAIMRIAIEVESLEVF